jgi:hypothetical protein
MSAKYGECWAQGLILQWINQIIKEQRLPFKKADQEVRFKTVVGIVKYPDIVIWNRTGEKAACLVELKTPIISAYDANIRNDVEEKYGKRFFKL